MGDSEFADEVLDLARQAEGELCLEITETAVISNPQLALEHIERFADAGLKISIDDYGTGLSSLAYLKQMRAHELKIDKAFVIGMAEGQKDALLVRSTVDLAHSLGLKVTAEGVGDRHGPGPAGRHGLRPGPGLLHRPADGPVGPDRVPEARSRRRGRRAPGRRRRTARAGRRGPQALLPRRASGAR